MRVGGRSLRRRFGWWAFVRDHRQATVVVILLQVLAAGPPGPAQGAMPPPHGPQGTAFMLLWKLGCDRAVPGYQTATAARYAAWRQENAAVLAQAEASPEFQRMLAEHGQHPAALTPADRQQAEEQCENLADLLGPAGPPDARLATPEKTWALYHGSLRAGDRTTAAACLILQAKRSFTTTTQRLTDLDLRKMADDTTAFRMTRDHGDSQEAEVVRNGVGYLVGFQRVRGEWKISTM